MLGGNPPSSQLHDYCFVYDVDLSPKYDQTIRNRRVPISVRQDSKLFCKVIEAKGVSSVDQIFCTIHLDNDKYSQTRVIHGKRQERRMLRKSVWTDPCNPFWAEEFEYNTLPQHFQELKIIMWAFPHGAKAAVPVGRVRIPRQVLLNQTNNTESWHPMRSAAKEHPVPGRLRVQIDTKNSPAGPCVSITLVEGRDMIYSGSPKTCACIIELINSVSGEIIEHIGEITGQVVDDTVKFKDAASTHFTLKAKHEHLTIRFRLRMDQKDALGQKTLEVALLSTVATDVWYNLTSADDGDTNPTLDRETTVQLRLKVLYQENSILPLSDYQELWSQFSDFPVPVFQVLDKVCYSKEDMAISLLRLYASRGEALMFLKNVIELETTNTKTFGTLFRAQSITTKAIEYYFKTVGAEYLAKTLKPHIDAVIAAKKCTEVNPSFIQKGDGNVKKNLKALENNIKRFTDAILDSVVWLECCGCDQLPYQQGKDLGPIKN
ncbi:hypothetical protein SARC_04172 [Sphaeroforma arctica JP610]|uniref:Uncharacterized protein n=1 Tax=Sphaeroforma arctica JP610 TaxID=667725 RepID=A0A0L0G5U6_9EUKA|nr:hypothetical protein SARC_04172 [Sphaeroforma arctica JP610]KNC83588.1 hypothetical protein SARC_04172 [Sphaeroforma arctica JP610]|eukprot:XP_014157490.1 hypothetical protein SARC_04172 [Sphaeroforma arctica JP610]